ncbi:MAG TPA: phosphodiester glycosidase family protein [Polyangia bacterium]|nr:phosphodiester glycosidase family protein [Polyangia bacterium]
MRGHALVRVLALAATLATARPGQAAPAPIDWQALGPGAWRATLAAGDGTPLLLFRFAFARYRAEVVVGAGWPPARETAAELVHRLGAAAAVNGGFFDGRGAPLGLRVAAGRTRAPLRPKADWGVLLLEPAGARIVHTHELAPGDGARGAIQVGPRLVVHGQALHLKPQLARRTAVALEPAGDALTLVVADAPVDANDLAQRLAAAGFDAALLLDGGPSTQLSVAVGGARLDLPGGYPVPDLLAVVPRSPPRAR